MGDNDFVLAGDGWAGSFRTQAQASCKSSTARRGNKKAPLKQTFHRGFKMVAGEGHDPPTCGL